MNVRTGVLLCCVLLAAGCERNSGSSAKLGVAAPPLTGLEWVKNGPVELKPGTVYVVEFWATWCPPCRKSIPHLTELQHKYKDKNLTIVGISTERVDKVKPFVEERGSEMDYAVAVDTTGAASRGYMDAFRRNTIPSAFVVDAGGKIVWVGHPLDNMDAVIEKALAERAPASGG